MNLQLQRNQSILQKYMPAPAAGILARWIDEYNFKLKIKKPRSSKLGDYTPPHNGKNHTITINRNLNPYAFLITIVHEVAHLLVWKKYGNRVKPHGREWKTIYASLLKKFFFMNIFPNNVLHALQKHLRNPTASGCTDLTLYRVLKEYDAEKNILLLEQIPSGSFFRVRSKRIGKEEKVFKKNNRRKVLFECVELKSKRVYLFHPFCKVIPIS